MFALSSSKRFALAAMCGVAMLAAISACAQDDPPPEAGRISYISGTVSIQAVSSDDWGQAYPNLPVGPGDRIFTDSDGRAEIQVGQTYVRIGPNSDVTLVDDSAVQHQLWHCPGFDPPAQLRTMAAAAARYQHAEWQCGIRECGRPARGCHAD